MKSGYQPINGSGYQPVKSISNDPPKLGSCAKKLNQEKINIKSTMENNTSMFDPNEKDPVMRALNMVKEYCNASIRKINQGRAISTDCFKADTYQDIINFIEEHQEKCQYVKIYSSLDLDKLVEETDNSYIKHLENEVEWFKSRMDAYKESFFKVCDIVEHSDCADIIKKLVEEERKKY